ncbi:hypothetical protein PAXRUDRAFT_431751 [Paxillus rubicundulus Ve08.2h10]|uniref:Unplaced genomic scaffold scaffold_269, whole genome shotgun sequence n=1 Tax=Paxillus rubicundulus Ve08.2h10 TaxID=930991 RepID=A0A0D0E870_9AGAM|nr:hypothetical protein PAXRUDRAFT_431751 [Paxillus rubicundulus Ve08.2h10]
MHISSCNSIGCPCCVPIGKQLGANGSLNAQGNMLGIAMINQCKEDSHSPGVPSFGGGPCG